MNGEPEFDIHDRQEIARRLDLGTKYLLEAGFAKPQTFVAPYDRITRTSYRELAKRFKVISTGWFEWGRIPTAWWPKLFAAKLRRRKHWSVKGITLLSHPGCILSYQRNYDTMLDQIKAAVQANRITVLVTHWWEFFRDGEPDARFIRVLHQTAEYLANDPEVRVIRFEAAADLA